MDEDKLYPNLPDFGSDDDAYDQWEDNKEAVVDQVVPPYVPVAFKKTPVTLNGRKLQVVCKVARIQL
jgi:hypothetical protein